MAYLLYLFSRIGVSGLDPNRCLAILEDDEKKTAGQLAQMLRKHLCVSEELDDKLAEALEARNRLIHRYLIENVERLVEIREHEVLVKEIRALRATVRRTQEQLDPIVRALAERIDGVSFDAWAAEAREKFLRGSREH